MEGVVVKDNVVIIDLYRDLKTQLKELENKEMVFDDEELENVKIKFSGKDVARLIENVINTLNLALFKFNEEAYNKFDDSCEMTTVAEVETEVEYTEYFSESYAGIYAGEATFTRIETTMEEAVLYVYSIEITEGSLFIYFNYELV